MKNKIICPNCGIGEDASDFISRMDGGKIIQCSSCLELLEIYQSEIDYHSYEIELYTPYTKPKDFSIMTHNTPESNNVSVGFRHYEWEIDRELKKGIDGKQFEALITGLKKEIIEMAKTYYRCNLNQILRIEKKELQ